MTNDNAPDELTPAEQPPTDDPWVVVTPMAALKSQQTPVSSETPRRKAFPCAECGAYWPCEHETPRA
jgi:hypothetical protein